MQSRRRFLGLALAGVVAAVGVAACGSDSKSSAGGPATTAGAATTAGGATTTAGQPTTTARTEKVTLRLGYFPNITHATALVGVAKGIFQEKLGSNVTLETQTFNDGTKASEALAADAIDATYIGPNPAINLWQKSGGKAIKIVSGSTSGGAFFVVKPEINSAADLKGKTVASPGLGNTQDVALRTWLKGQGLSTDSAGGGDVSIKPQDNSTTLQTFVDGTIQGAWVPEPWATRLIQEGGGKVLVAEKDLWPQGQYVTTHLIVAQKFLDKYPDVIEKLLEGQIAANDYVNANPDDAQKVANSEIGRITTKPLKDAVVAASWKNLEFTDDPIASSLKTSADNAIAAGLLKPVDLTGIYDLDPLNAALKAAGEPPVTGL